MSRMTKECPNCLKVFVTYWPVVCCSMDCRDEYGKRNRREIRQCTVCGEDFECKISSPQKLCGRDCIGEHNRAVKTGAQYVEREIVVCKNSGCGRTFERRITDTTWEFCGKSCAYSAKREKILRSPRAHKFAVQLTNGSTIEVRSRWEAVFIKDFLEKRKIRWTYEPDSIILEDGKTRYTPDFHLLDDDVFVEIKGFRKSNAWKASAARKMGYSVILADKDVLENVYGLDMREKNLVRVVKKYKDINTL